MNDCTHPNKNAHFSLYNSFMYTKSPPVLGIAVAISLIVRAEATVSSPPIIQAIIPRNGEPELLKTCDDLKNMPEPITIPITIVIASSAPTCFFRFWLEGCDSFGCSLTVCCIKFRPFKI